MSGRLDRRVLVEGLIPCSVCEEPLFPVGGETAHQSHFLGERRRDEGIARTVAAHPSAMQAAVAIIADHARRLEQVSANTVRDAMDAAQIPGPVRGAAFRQAVKDGLIRADGLVASSDEGTHAHRVFAYSSRVFRGAA